MARAVIEVGSQCKKNSIPKKVVQNLMVLEKFVFKDHQGTMPSVLLMLLRGKGQRNCKKDAMAKNKSTGTEAQKRPTNFNGAANHCDSLVSQDKYTKSSFENLSEVTTQKVAQEESTGESVLQFSSASNPLDVIHSHMKVYSKCCVRHDIHNIIVFGTTIPASDIFGPKRRYASAKDLRSDQKHGDLISLNARNGKLDFWKETSTSVQNHLSILHHHNDKQPHLMHLKLSLMRSMIVKAIDLEHVQVMRDVVLTQPLRHQVYDTHALVISQPIILSTVLKATVQDFVRSNSFIAFKNALSMELHYLFGICRPTVSRIYTSTIEMFKLIVSAMRPVRRSIPSIPSNIKENINTTVTIFNEKAKMLTTPSKLWVILRGGDLKKKKKKEMAAHMPAQEEKSISLQHATRHSEPLDIPSAALTLVIKSNPLEVVRSHFQVYSKCCTRHDIQNILAIGTEYPASAAFTSSSSHSSSASTASNYSINFQMKCKQLLMFPQEFYYQILLLR